ncbi:hypothetical protein ABZ801_11400 [Actinomadura sp. NPDC047616]|uniref:hypothetical protein n=1 Tax=Actinomadura sp. NPDC047616 TaxID=3155914 RepID=UPI0033FEE48A
MRLLGLAAVAHPEGNRIDVRWTLPAAPAFPHVRVVRRERTHPTTPNPASAADGTVVPVTDDGGSAVDKGLRGETVYYYGLYPYKSVTADGQIVIENAAEQVDRANRTSAMATSPAGLAAEMYALLPSIYHRYDTAPPPRVPPGMRPEDRHRGALRRFLDLPGGQLDQFYGYATAILGFLDLERVDGALLPLLADWIGWRTDHRLEFGEQRTEIRNAPALYRAVGLVPVIEATVQRVAGERSRVKEFVDNVATTNRPARLTLWQRTRRQGWSDAELLSLDASFGGRAAVAAPAAGPPRSFHEREQDGRFQIWSKELGAAGWTGSEPLADGPLTYKDPSAAVQGGNIVVFWSAYDETRRRWSIQSRTRRNGAWSKTDTFVPPGGNADTDRRKPVAVADASGLWLFWLEKAQGRWVVKYNRHDGTRWQITPSPSVPIPAAQTPAVLDDVFALFQPANPLKPLWLFWAGQVPVPADQDPASPRQTRWTVAYSVKAGVDPAVTNDWSDVRFLPKGNDGDHDREPCALPLGNGNLEVFWSSHRGGRWAVWRNVLNVATGGWGTAERLTDFPQPARAPAAFTHGDTTVLVFRSSRSLSYQSRVYSATTTVDARWSGTQTLHVRDTVMPALRGTYDDFGTYIRDAGRDGVRTDDDRYAADTVGVYLPAGTDDQRVSRLRQVLREFMPATNRAVFVHDPGSVRP